MSNKKKSYGWHKPSSTKQDTTSYNKYYKLGEETYRDDIPLPMDGLLVYFDDAVRVKASESYMQSKRGFLNGYAHKAMSCGWNVRNGRRMGKAERAFNSINAQQQQLL